MEKDILLNCDENECINGNIISNASGIYYEKENMTLKDFSPHQSFPSLVK